MAYTEIDDPSAYFQIKLYTAADAYTFDGNSDGDGFGNFKTAPPSGHFALCTKNLAEYG